MLCNITILGAAYNYVAMHLMQICCLEIFSAAWLVLLTLATVTRSEHYHIVPVDSCRDYRNGTCFTLEQLVQTDGGDNLTLIELSTWRSCVN